MLFDQVVLVSTLIGSILFHYMLSLKVRNILVPWLLSYYLLVITVIGAAGEAGGLFHFLFTAMNFVPVMVICDGLNDSQRRCNPAWTAFLFFYAYMFAIGWTGYFKFDGTTFYLQTLVNTFCMGYFTARWICRTEGALQKLLVPLLFVGGACVFYYGFVHQGLTGELDNSGRLQIEVESTEGGGLMNPNAIAMRLGTLLPFLVLGFLHFDRRRVIFKFASVVVMFFLGLVLVRTGARTAAMALFPCVWYFFRFTRNRRKFHKYFLWIVVIVVLFVVGIMFTNRGQGVLRAFRIIDKESKQEYGGNLEAMTTGRWSMYENNLKRFSALELAFGKGCANSLYDARGERIARYRGGNAHSMYVTVLYRSGIVGLVLFLWCMVVFFRQAGRLGTRGNMAKFLFAVWMLMGIGESWGMNNGAVSILAGLGFGLIVRKPAENSEFGEMYMEPHVVLR